MTFFYVRDDTHQIFDARVSVPSDKKMREYSELYGCDISIIEGTTVKTYTAQHSVQSDAANVSAKIDEAVKELSSAFCVPAKYWQRR